MATVDIGGLKQFTLRHDLIVQIRESLLATCTVNSSPWYLWTDGKLCQTQQFGPVQLHLRLLKVNPRSFFGMKQIYQDNGGQLSV